MHSARCRSVPGLARNAKEPRRFAPDAAPARTGATAWGPTRRRSRSSARRAGRLTAQDDFGIAVTLTAPAGYRASIVTAVKGLVDGPLAGLQRADALAPDVLATLLGPPLGPAAG